MSASEFEEWRIFLASDPDPDVKRQYEAALVASTVARSIGGSKGKMEDFLLKYGPPKRVSPDELSMKLRTFANMHNAQGRNAAKKRGTKFERSKK